MLELSTYRKKQREEKDDDWKNYNERKIKMEIQWGNFFFENTSENRYLTAYQSHKTEKRKIIIKKRRDLKIGYPRREDFRTISKSQIIS